jgi:hypothetical protein
VSINLNTIENYFVTTLAAALTTVQVQAWPDDYRAYVSKFNAPKGALLVRYNGSDYTPDPPEPNGLEILVQEREMRWTVTIFMRNAFGHDAADVFTDGIYTLIGGVVAAMSGKTVTGLTDLTVIWPRRDYFVAKLENSIYVYEVEFGVSGPEAVA